MSLSNKVALVTGAAQGMGRAIALRLAGEGASVVATDINGRLVEQTSIDIRELGHDAIAVEADIGDIEDMNQVVDKALNAFGRIDILVNNAGVTRYSDIMDLTVEDWDRNPPRQRQGRVLLPPASRPRDDRQWRRGQNHQYRVNRGQGLFGHFQRGLRCQQGRRDFHDAYRRAPARTPTTSM